MKSIDKTICLKSRQDIAEDESFIEQNTLSPNLCYLNNQYRCPGSGLCSDEPCQEWSQCQDSSQYKCWDGICVSDPKYCRNNETGCPVYSPFRCNYTSNCVSNMTECESDDSISARLSSICKIRYNLSLACPFDGSCATTLSDCPTKPNSWMTLYPNTESSSVLSASLIPQCPE